MIRLLNRKSFVTTLGTVGLGLGLLAGTLATAPSALAQADEEMRRMIEERAQAAGSSWPALPSSPLCDPANWEACRLR